MTERNPPPADQLFRLRDFYTPWLLRGSGAFLWRCCWEKWHRRRQLQTTSPATIGGFATGHTVTTVTLATCQQVSADCRSFSFLILQEENGELHIDVPIKVE